MLFGIACLHLHHTAPHSGAFFLFLIISFFFSFFLPSTIMSGGGEVTEIGKCWYAASDIVSDYNDNSAKIGNSA